MNPVMKLSIAGSTVVCAALLSFSWSEQRGVSLSVESALARHVSYGRTGSTGAAAVRTAHYRGRHYAGNPNNRGGLVGGGDSGVGGGFGRPSYGFTGATGTYRVGAGAAAAGTAAAVAATSPRWGWGGGPGYAGGPYYGSGALGAQASYAAAPMAGPSGWHRSGATMACTSGTWVRGGNGMPFRCK